MTQTALLYLENMYVYSAVARIEGVRRGEDGRQTVLLDQTILYPQGGGQASDTGTIEGDGFVFAVHAVSYDAGIVVHTGETIEGTLPTDGAVTIRVNEARRARNSRLQSAGHLLLNAMKNVGQPLVATKGYHFPDGPYVEFKGTLAEDKRDQVLAALQRNIDRLVEADLPITARLVSYDTLREICDNVPVNVPTDKPSRVVTIDGLSQPCGGTHVKSTSELVGLRVEKIRSRKGDTRLSYTVP